MVTILPLRAPMYATTWLDRETFLSIIDYCRARAGYHELDADENNESVSLVESRLPDLAAYDGPGQAIDWISLHYTGPLSECTRLFDLGQSGQIGHAPSVRVVLKEVPFSVDGAVRGKAHVSYSSLDGHTTRNGSVVDPSTDLSFIVEKGNAEPRMRMLDLFLEKLGVGEAVRVGTDEEGVRYIVSSDERYAILPDLSGGTEPRQSVLRQEKVALAFGLNWSSYHDDASIQVYGLPKDELQEYALSIIDELGDDHVRQAQATWVTKDREVYDAFCSAIGDVVGEWRIHLMTRGGFSVSDLVEASERLSEGLTHVEVGFDVELPVVGLTYVAVEAGREESDVLRYRLRFYPDYENDEWIDLPKERPSETPEGQGLPRLRALEDEELARKQGRACSTSPIDLVIPALLDLWGDGRDIVDYEYEE